uniref:Transmembrane emp24 domain-containing protein 10-like n=1 Tax=Callorhinchus milii TaxID=7868 RepID=A0A4W3GGT9_CALMI
MIIELFCFGIDSCSHPESYPDASERSETLPDVRDKLRLPLAAVLFQVTDSSGHILYSKEDATKGKFAFTTDDYDMFEICFESKLPPGEFPDQVVTLNTKHGVEAKSYEDVSHHCFPFFISCGIL